MSLSLKLSATACLITFLMFLNAGGSPPKRVSHALMNTNYFAQGGQRQIDQWLDYPFDPSAPIGNAKNPAVILPAELATLVANLTGANRIGEIVIVSAAELKKAADLPFARTMLSPVLSQLPNVKSFDGFSAVDATGVTKNLPSLLTEPANDAGRRLTRENPERYGNLLRNGDLVFGSHLVNYMTWGKYNHVAIVTDAAQGQLVEATAEVPSDKPGVRNIDWKSFAANYVHVGVVRVRGASPDQIAQVIRWVEVRKGKPYRWPIIMGLDKTDDSRFYCSQLVWAAYKQILNIDLDADKGVLVFPDDLYENSAYVNQIVP